MQRQDSQPVVSKSPNASSHSPRNQQDGPSGNGAGPLRRRQPNLLSGGAILRPLTKSHLEPSQPELDQQPAPNDPRAGPLGQRAKSTANVVDLGRMDDEEDSGSRAWGERERIASETPAFQRRRTEGDDMAALQPWERARLLRKRQGELSSSFRSHGW
jgi:hypothetical protein